VERRLLRCGLDLRGHKVDVDTGPRHLERSVRLVPAWPQQMQEHTRSGKFEFYRHVGGCARARVCESIFASERVNTFPTEPEIYIS
jgi:hypothetical protein